MDYQGLYEDLLAMEARAQSSGHYEFSWQCFDFRVDLLTAHCVFVGRMAIA